MVISWIYSSRYHCQALASDHAIMLNEYMCKLQPLRLSLYQHDAIDSPIRTALNATAGSSVRACGRLARVYAIPDDAVVFTIRLRGLVHMSTLELHLCMSCLSKRMQVDALTARYNSNKPGANHNMLSESAYTGWFNG